MTTWTLPPMLRNAALMLASGVVASLLCSKVFAATLPIEELAQAPVVAASATPTKIDDAAAAAMLRSFIAQQRPVAAVMAVGYGR